MRAPRLNIARIVVASWLALTGLACSVEDIPLNPIEDPPEQLCIRNTRPGSFDIFFVLDVSGSMGPFLTELGNSLLTFANNFPEVDEDDRRIKINYYVIGFVNDVKVFGNGRMTTVIALQDAIEQAVIAGSSDYNLNVRTFNAETEENLLDAVAEAMKIEHTSEASLVLLATDAPFVENPASLNQGIFVQSKYADVLAGLEQMEARVHAFIAKDLAGITYEFNHQPPLTSLPGSTIQRFDNLNRAGDQIHETLAFIAKEASCN